MDISDITDSESLKELIRDTDKLVVSYYSPQCVNCKLISYYLYHLSLEHTNITFIKCNINSISGLREKLGINTLPIIFFYNNEKIVCRYVGTLEKTLKNLIKQYY